LGNQDEKPVELWAGLNTIFRFDSDGSLTLPGDIKSESAINIDVNLSDSTLRRWRFGEDGDLNIPGGLTTDSTRLQFNTANSEYWVLNSDQKRIEFSESAGYIKFGTATKDNTGAFTDIELFSYGTGDGTNAVYISAGGSPTNNRWKFSGDGDLTLPASGDIVDSTGVSQTAQREEGSWTVTTGTNTYNFTVPMDGTYVMWVKGNIPNGIITWNATVSVSNSNVPAIGTQYAWNYTGGGSPILLTAIPDQIRGTAGTISTDATYAGTTSNRFDFTIANTSGESQTVYYGYTKI
jgi:hypothetical protein